MQVSNYNKDIDFPMVRSQGFNVNRNPILKKREYDRGTAVIKIMILPGDRNTWIQSLTLPHTFMLTLGK